MALIRFFVEFPISSSFTDVFSPMHVHLVCGALALRMARVTMVFGSDPDVRFIYDTISVLLTHPALPGERLKTLLTFLKWSLPQRFFHPADELQELLRDLKFVYLLPGANGESASLILNMIRQELDRNGSAYRNRFPFLPHSTT